MINALKINIFKNYNDNISKNLNDTNIFNLIDID